MARRPEDLLDQRSPGLLLFLAGGDSQSCCAKNYERFIFRDKKVLDLAKRFTTVRVDRSGLSQEDLNRWELKREKPAILLLDGDGLVRARFDACTSASDVAEAMVAVLKAAAAKAKVAQDMTEAFAEVDELMKAKAWREAGVALRKLARLKGGPVAGVPRAERLLAAIARTGEEELTAALALPTCEARYTRLLELRHIFWDFPAVERIRLELTALVEGEATKDAIREHQARTLLEEGLATIAKGQRQLGRSILLKVGRDFPGTKAAARAQELLAEK